MPVVSLIFPPLVWSAFDSVYPSTAVLSAFLRQHGIATTQDDLNDEFASFLIDGPLLGRLGAVGGVNILADTIHKTRNDLEAIQGIINGIAYFFDGWKPPAWLVTLVVFGTVAVIIMIAYLLPVLVGWSRHVLDVGSVAVINIELS